ncbi:MAG: hemerythrin domain-containing protein, partial [Streptomyces sp.]|nr:hemerythrin domain-containing protein [Streptomyces sp.]
LARLRAEHRRIAEGLAELRALPAGPGADSGGELAARLDGLAAEMERHFAYEEEHLIPALTGGALGE